MTSDLATAENCDATYGEHCVPRLSATELAAICGTADRVHAFVMSATASDFDAGTFEVLRHIVPRVDVVSFGGDVGHVLPVGNHARFFEKSGTKLQTLDSNKAGFR